MLTTWSSSTKAEDFVGLGIEQHDVIAVVVLVSKGWTQRVQCWRLGDLAHVWQQHAGH